MNQKEKEDFYKMNFKNQVNSGKQNSEHHIIPQSREGSSEDNKILIDRNLHEKYHDLFLNRTPEEALEFLVEYFWGGQITHIHTFLKKQREQKQVFFNHFI